LPSKQPVADRKFIETGPDNSFIEMVPVVDFLNSSWLPDPYKNGSPMVGLDVFYFGMWPVGTIPLDASHSTCLLRANTTGYGTAWYARREYNYLDRFSVFFYSTLPNPVSQGPALVDIECSFQIKLGK
jgi:hypothetical protein